MDVMNIDDNITINNSRIITENILRIKTHLNILKTLTANPSTNDWEAIKLSSDAIEKYGYEITQIANIELNK